MSIPDIGALAAQQKLEKLATECGMVDLHTIILMIQPGPEGMQVGNTLASTCGECWSLVRADYWMQHHASHQNAKTPAVSGESAAGVTLQDFGPQVEAMLAKKMRSDEA